jgi:hypothetical protein
MVIVRLFVSFYYLIIFLMGASAARGVGQGEPRALVILIFCVALWNWRWLFEFVQDRRWREWL